MEVSSLRNVLECEICCENYTAEGERSPKLLSCGHTFCSSCIINMAEKRKIICPICRSMTSMKVPSLKRGADKQNKLDLPDNLTIMALLAASSTSTTDDMGIYCSKHPKKECNIYCEDCDSMICVRCAFGPTHISHKTKLIADEEADSHHTGMDASKEDKQPLMHSQIKSRTNAPLQGQAQGQGQGQGQGRGLATITANKKLKTVAPGAANQGIRDIDQRLNTISANPDLPRGYIVNNISISNVDSFTAHPLYQEDLAETKANERANANAEQSKNVVTTTNATTTTEILSRNTSLYTLDSSINKSTNVETSQMPTNILPSHVLFANNGMSPPPPQPSLVPPSHPPPPVASIHPTSSTSSTSSASSASSSSSSSSSSSTSVPNAPLLVLHVGSSIEEHVFAMNRVVTHRENIQLVEKYFARLINVLKEDENKADMLGRGAGWIKGLVNLLEAHKENVPLVIGGCEILRRLCRSNNTQPSSVLKLSIDELESAGICDIIVNILTIHNSSTDVFVSTLMALAPMLTSLTITQKVQSLNICELLATALKAHNSCAALVTQVSTIVANLCNIEASLRTKFSHLGLCDVLVNTMNDFMSDSITCGYICYALASIALHNNADICNSIQCMSVISKLLREHGQCDSVCSQAFKSIVNLTTNNMNNKEYFGNADGCEAVVTAMKYHINSSNVTTCTLFYMVIGNLCSGNPQNANKMSELGVCKLMVDTLNSHFECKNVTLIQAGITTIKYLALFYDDNIIQLGDAGACHVIMSIFMHKIYAKNEMIKEQCKLAIKALSYRSKANAQRIIDYINTLLPLQQSAHALQQQQQQPQQQHSSTLETTECVTVTSNQKVVIKQILGGDPKSICRFLIVVLQLLTIQDEQGRFPFLEAFGTNKELRMDLIAWLVQHNSSVIKQRTDMCEKAFELIYKLHKSCSSNTSNPLSSLPLAVIIQALRIHKANATEAMIFNGLSLIDLCLEASSSVGDAFMPELSKLIIDLLSKRYYNIYIANSQGICSILCNLLCTVFTMKQFKQVFNSPQGDSEAPGVLVRMLSHFSSQDSILQPSSQEICRDICRFIHNVCQNSSENRNLFSSAGGCEIIAKVLQSIVSMLRHSVDKAEEEMQAKDKLSASSDAPTSSIHASLELPISLVDSVFCVIVSLGTQHDSNKEIFGRYGICQTLVNSLQIIVEHIKLPASNQIYRWGCLAMSTLSANNLDNKNKLGLSGACDITTHILNNCLSATATLSAPVAEQVCFAIRNLSAKHNGNKEKLRKACIPLVQVLSTFIAHATVCESACGAIRNLCFLNNENKTVMGDVGVCQTLVHVMNTYLVNANIIEQACAVVVNLCIGNEKNKQNLIQAGAIDFLTKISLQFKDKRQVLDQAALAYSCLTDTSSSSPYSCLTDTSSSSPVSSYSSSSPKGSSGIIKANTNSSTSSNRSLPKFTSSSSSSSSSSPSSSSATTTTTTTSSSSLQGLMSMESSLAVGSLTASRNTPTVPNVIKSPTAQSEITTHSHSGSSQISDSIEKNQADGDSTFNVSNSQIGDVSEVKGVCEMDIATSHSMQTNSSQLKSPAPDSHQLLKTHVPST